MLEDIEYIDIKNNPFTVESSEHMVIHCFVAYSSFINLYDGKVHIVETLSIQI